MASALAKKMQRVTASDQSTDDKACGNIHFTKCHLLNARTLLKALEPMASRQNPVGCPQLTDERMQSEPP